MDRLAAGAGESVAGIRAQQTRTACKAMQTKQNMHRAIKGASHERTDRFATGRKQAAVQDPQGHKAAGKIMKLGQMITDRVPAKLRRLTVEDPEYWGLASIVTDEMADVALKMKVRQPMTLPELEKATGKPAKELEPLLYQMSCVGLLEYNWENPRREKQYILPMFVPGSAEFFNMNKQQIADHPEVTAFFERMTFLPLEHITAMVPPGGAGIGMHVIPVEKAIETENHSLDIEHISHWLKSTRQVCRRPLFLPYVPRRHGRRLRR